AAASFFLQAEDGIRDDLVTGVQTCALPILLHRVTGAPYRDLLAIELDPALDHASVLAEQGGDELGAPRAHEAGDAQDLSLSQVRSEERRVGKGWRVRLWWGTLPARQCRRQC